MMRGHIVSPIYSSVSQFTLETYCLHKNSQMIAFFARENEGCWVIKNTYPDADQGITMITNVETYKK